jgi:hypothetical protein
MDGTRKIESSNPSYISANHTQTITSWNRTVWIEMTLWEFTLSTEVKSGFISKQNQFECDVSSTCHIKLPLHKIPSCFKSPVLKFMNHSRLTWRHMHLFLLHFMLMTYTHTHMLVQLGPEIFLEMFPI